jgi:hypothetical protein
MVNPAETEIDSMWIVNLARNRPYTFIVAAILILILGFTSIANDVYRCLSQYRHSCDHGHLEL